MDKKMTKNDQKKSTKKWTKKWTKNDKKMTKNWQNWQKIDEKLKNTNKKYTLRMAARGSSNFFPVPWLIRKILTLMFSKTFCNSNKKVRSKNGKLFLKRLDEWKEKFTCVCIERKEPSRMVSGKQPQYTNEYSMPQYTPTNAACLSIRHRIQHVI